MFSRSNSMIPPRTQSRPNEPRAACSRVFGRRLLVSMLCWKSPIRVSRHSRRPNSSGEFVEHASNGAVTNCARL